MCVYLSSSEMRWWSHTVMHTLFPRPKSTPKYECILTTVHAMTKSFVPFCSAQDGESTDMNCLVFWAYCENGKFLTKRQVYNKGILPILGNF